MGQHAKRFDAAGAQKGTYLRDVVDGLKALADTIEERYDSNSPEVTGAMQRFEQGLALLSRAPQLQPEQPAEKPKVTRKAKPKAAESKVDGESEDEDPTNES